MSRRARTVTPTPTITQEGGAWHTLLAWNEDLRCLTYRVQADAVVGEKWGQTQEVERHRVPRDYYHLSVAESVVRALNAADRANIPPPPLEPPPIEKEST